MRKTICEKEIRDYVKKNLPQIQKETFEELINKQQTLKQSVKIFQLLLEALEKFHAQGLLHLELYPDRLFLCENYVILSSSEKSWRLSSTLNGQKCIKRQSPKVRIKYEEYLPPEVRLRKISQISYRSDIYSACAIFYSLLTGKPPQVEDFFAGERNWKLRLDLPIFESEPQEAVALAMKIIRRGLHPLPLKRYQNVIELKVEVERLFAQLSL